MSINRPKFSLRNKTRESSSVRECSYRTSHCLLRLIDTRRAHLPISSEGRTEYGRTESFRTNPIRRKQKQNLNPCRALRNRFFAGLRSESAVLRLWPVEISKTTMGYCGKTVSHPSIPPRAFGSARTFLHLRVAIEVMGCEAHAQGCGQGPPEE
jgi:hypothetical protein